MFFGHVVANLFADIARLAIIGDGVVFAGEIGFQHLADVLPDAERRDRLQVGMAFQENDACDELVRVMHLLDRFLALLPGEARKAPILGQAIVDPILVDGAELQFQRLVQAVDDSLVALHGIPRQVGIGVLGQFRPATKRFLESFQTEFSLRVPCAEPPPRAELRGRPPQMETRALRRAHPLADRDRVLDQDVRDLRETAAAAAAPAEAVVNEVGGQHGVGIIRENALDDRLDVAARDDVAGADDHGG
jgi:hypothetical protein